jgi:comEA protein
MKLRKNFTFILAIFLILGFSSFAAAAAEEAAQATAPSKLEGKLNINTADAKQLAMLPGIGEKTAANIIDYRTQNGNFKAVEDLSKVKGVGKKTLEKINNHIILEGQSTLKKATK